METDWPTYKTSDIIYNKARDTHTSIMTHNNIKKNKEVEHVR